MDIVHGHGGGIPTDEGGLFSFSGLNPGRYNLSAEAASGRAPEQELVVTENQQLRGVVLVLDESGATIHGVVSGLLPGERGRTRVEVRPQDQYGHLADTYVDDQGSYSLRLVPAGRLEVIAETPLNRQVSKTIELSKDDTDEMVNFEFNGSARLSGRVTRGGDPVPGVEVIAEPLDGTGVSASTMTNRAGAYRLDSLTDGNYKVKVRPGRRSAQLLVSGSTTLDFDLPALYVSGKVSDAVDGRPLPDVQLMIRFADPKGTVVMGTATGFQGEFSFGGLEAGAYQINATRPGYDLVDQHIEIADSVSDVTVSMRQTPGIELRVRDAKTGLALPNVQVSAGNNYMPVDLGEDGVGRIAPWFKGRDLVIVSYGYAETSVPAWNGAPLDIALSPVKTCMLTACAGE